MPIVELNNMENDVPVLIIGAGISGLLLAQQLRQLEIPFQIYERDSSFTARGSGWGLTLHWSLPALHELLPEHLLSRLRETYVDLGAVERGEGSTFPFFDLTTGERKGGVPQAGENQRIRVSRERLRNLLATDIEIQWGKSFKELSDYKTAVVAHFEDGTEVRGRMLFGCDGNRSRSMEDVNQSYVYQICISGSTEKEPFRSVAERITRPTNDERIALLREAAQSLAEPFRRFVNSISDSTTVKQLDLDDWVFPNNHVAASTYTLVGDAAHAMTMCR
ncbi:hypothetical protein N0V87_002425 [Didymella glomerata]|uniref:FAD-binding domain-containing protein n=1 Tax=Didymella glomerata TaxID=749621 RepID=A0A9W8X3U2_9PLEO|nr:hypothetical protein N0V87_002425 [Didymella glomerata]